MNFLANTLLISGIFLCAASLYIVQQLVKKLPVGEVRNNWKILSFFIVGFIVGYAGYMYLFATGQMRLENITYPAVCLAVAAFILLLCFLTYQTTRDISEALVVEQESIIDPVLDIYNRRYFERRIEEEIQRSRRYNQPLSIILFEIDQVGSIMESRGRLIGEVVLKKVSDFLVSSVRSSDIIARYDERRLVVATTQTKAEVAVVLAERFRGEIEKLEVFPNSEQSSVEIGPLTVTAGIAGVEERIKCGFDLTDAAEKAINHAMRKGKNQVCAYDASDMEVVEVSNMPKPATV